MGGALYLPAGKGFREIYGVYFLRFTEFYGQAGLYFISIEFFDNIAQVL